ncbi:MAG: acyl-CoA thioesterase II [Gammaproteobacteria bacterium]|nr:acyl-CoA thioesterase II [Gammaproteobacteria bacterium]MCP4089753.1 acyl-CoA thioesterase II [Gammaproteobacteria bacterium]MCP4278230.1 acyl-CoA thioesterase II [Gammaproteobacteria bacterium]MCP4831949.1 acyl-CoA thioesterase II [Gammaproteobacteria bacterium]MCP4927579.1 acyl-CoA thioesterase II [Gammaproteobacteria bacterium]
MDPVLADLLSLLRPEKIKEDVFRGESRDIGTPQVFGGQVLAQALAAAAQTVEAKRSPHSLHAYFLRRGDVGAPIDYEVDRARDGASFSNRRIVAVQEGRQIFHMAASFQRVETGVEHHAEMPDVPGPGGLTDRFDVDAAVLAQLHEKMQSYLSRKRPFMVRPVRQLDFLKPEKLEPVKHVWIRSVDALADDLLLHQLLLAYVSDYELLGTATLPHGVNFTSSNTQMASLDHALWFHRDFRIDQWLLFSFDSPNTSGARGLARSMVFTEQGELVASSAQEGLIRVRD